MVNPLCVFCDTLTTFLLGGVHGFRPFPSRGKVVTNEQVDQLRDEEGV